MLLGLRRIIGLLLLRAALIEGSDAAHHRPKKRSPGLVNDAAKSIFRCVLLPVSYLWDTPFSYNVNIAAM
jgi:hypothetical protein